MNTYIEVDYIDSEGIESYFGVKICAEFEQGITALDLAKKVIPNMNFWRNNCEKISN